MAAYHHNVDNHSNIPPSSNFLAGLAALIGAIVGICTLIFTWLMHG